MQYSVEIQNVVNNALSDLKQQHSASKLANTPITNTHFLARWVTKSIKSQCYDACVKDDLIRWQKASRSKGAGSDLLGTFERISSVYQRIVPIGEEHAPVLDSDIEAFMDHMENLGWEVVNEFELTEKTQIFADQPNSFVLCAKQCDDCFDGTDLVKPMSFYVRGNHVAFVEEATKNGFLLHKQTDYKSIVKYHGEYRIYPNNHGKKLAEIPFNIE
ncbi:DUF2913 family protein [Vibrio rumoiensis]|uniref:Alpha-acetolactate decarboxylase n=1 Tax=Vibrio rumoiensis 1S-45 TaxID=1188252 RepID=A0A1E5DZX7_9VIBR|nr:DUF2913 family protein [Vibrio rumoiensis]OEF23511.1 alpha-acetolactate decarboxylase [Vibrio rumoiensis 1S-45]